MTWSISDHTFGEDRGVNFLLSDLTIFSTLDGARLFGSKTHLNQISDLHLRSLLFGSAESEGRARKPHVCPLCDPANRQSLKNEYSPSIS